MAAAVGAVGGASMEAVDIIKAIKWHRQMPWNVQSDTIDPPQRRVEVRPGEERLPAPGWKAYWVAGVLRLFVSGALVGAVAATYPQSTNPLVAFLIGLGALSAVQQVITLVPLMVKSAGRAALGGVVEEAQQRVQDLQQKGQQPGPGQSNGALPGPSAGSPSAGNPVQAALLFTRPVRIRCGLQRSHWPSPQPPGHPGRNHRSIAPRVVVARRRPWHPAVACRNPPRGSSRCVKPRRLLVHADFAGSAPRPATRRPPNGHRCAHHHRWRRHRPRTAARRPP